MNLLVNDPKAAPGPTAMSGVLGSGRTPPASARWITLLTA
jgi:hypothetical protein